MYQVNITLGIFMEISHCCAQIWKNNTISVINYVILIYFIELSYLLVVLDTLFMLLMHCMLVSNFMLVNK